MNIGIDLRCLSTPFRTGVGEFTFELLSAIFKADKSNNYYLFSNSYSKFPIPNFEGDNIQNIELGFPNKLLNLAQIIGYPALDNLIIKKAGIQKLDFFFSPHLNFSSISNRTKHLLLIHDLTFEFFPQYLTLKQNAWHRLVSPKYQCNKAHKIFVPSENTKRDIIQQYEIDEKKVVVLYPGLSSAFGTPENPVNIKIKYNLPENYILFLGTIEPRKNLISLLKAFDISYEKFRNLHLVIAGAPGWKNKDLFDEIKNSKSKDNIHVLNYVSNEDKSELYKHAKIFIYPSIYEGFGFPVLEALASGVPVITSNRSSLLEITKDTVYLVNPNVPVEISSGIETILNSKNKEALINKGKLLANEFQWEKTAEVWLNHL